MLVELRVRDIGIISRVDWGLGRGLNVITGETGAGKSLVVGSVEALLSGKVGGELIRHGASEAYIEGVFSIPSGDDFAHLREILAENGLEPEDDSLVISFTPRRQGRSVVRVNGRAMPRGVVGNIGRFMIDIHGQSEHLSLRRKETHLDLLDSYADTWDMRRGFAARAAELAEVEAEMARLAAAEEELARREELMRFQHDEIARAELKEGEEEELIRQRDILASAEALKAQAHEAYLALSGDDSLPAVDRVGEAAKALKKMAHSDPSLAKQLAFLEDTVYGLEEAARDIRAYGEALEYDPARLEEFQNRLEMINGLKRKYGGSITAVLECLDRLEKDLGGLTHSSERRAELETRRSAIKEEMGAAAASLSLKRKQAAVRLESQVEAELKELNMAGVRFEVALQREEDPEGIPLPEDGTCVFTSSGVDIVEFVASTNPGEPLKPLVKIASTGEISRFTLALKGALSGADPVPVLIFDEVDIGVGGRSGEVIGRKLWSLARDRQVICVTHLPQIAAFADAHYGIHKEVVGERTMSMLEPLDGDARVKELAAMIGGRTYGENTADSARELMRKAEGWKQTQ